MFWWLLFCVFDGSEREREMMMLLLLLLLLLVMMTMMILTNQSIERMDEKGRIYLLEGSGIGIALAHQYTRVANFRLFKKGTMVFLRTMPI